IEESRLIINPGAVGQPRDGDPRAAYIIFEGDQRTLQYRRVSYPLEQTQEKMRRIGLPHRLISRLALGW
ncbi:MAG: metallophosphatase family protein, partial [Chloroflexi bacterium]|nr:metallophosphatase family protein [Chloroflexota bacterium]